MQLAAFMLSSLLHSVRWLALPSVALLAASCGGTDSGSQPDGGADAGASAGGQHSGGASSGGNGSGHAGTSSGHAGASSGHAGTSNGGGTQGGAGSAGTGNGDAGGASGSAGAGHPHGGTGGLGAGGTNGGAGGAHAGGAHAGGAHAGGADAGHGGAGAAGAGHGGANAGGAGAGHGGTNAGGAGAGGAGAGHGGTGGSAGSAGSGGATQYLGPTVGAAKSFAALAYSGITAANISPIIGDIGVSAGAVSTITGFDSPSIKKFGIDSLAPNDQLTMLAQQAVTALVGNIDPRPCDADYTSVVGGLTGDITLNPGVTCMNSFSNDVLLNGHLTLDAHGDPNAFFIIRGNLTLTVADAAQVILTNGAEACGVFWRISKQVTIGKTVQFYGNVIAGSAITMKTGSTLVGRALAQTEGVHFDANTVTVPSDGLVGSAGVCTHLQ